MCKIIAISNQKGGVGKTTTTMNLGVGLGRKGKKVLLIDLDSQGNLTQNCGFSENDELDLGISHLFARLINPQTALEGINDDFFNQNKINLHDKFRNVELLPSSINLAQVEVALVNAASRETLLKRIIKPFKNNYDYILIDCPPSLGMLSVNAMTAANSIIVPIKAEFFSNQGVKALINSIHQAKALLNENLEILGILVTMYDSRLSSQNEVLESIKAQYGSQIRIFRNNIPVSSKVSQKQSSGLPILDEKRNRVSENYGSFINEVLEIEGGLM